MVDPLGNGGHGTIVSTGSEEARIQGFTGNALQTDVVKAIQGRARKERSGSGGYLCTGMECYVGGKEPNHYDAMALSHARVGKVVFGKWDGGKGGMGGTKWKGLKGVQDIEDTNHTYRVFFAKAPA
ncbi:hypothetical protein TrRE_jg5403 [Triparma retinervis]|uniref:Uncharacterized protein n=1 Tax=Triparma retinervis TaxID=2557542 RepID=A0A9W7A793_9STRA|nr:hypothetical protein TrRE_jg5403 [Triparma retinervis]